MDMEQVEQRVAGFLQESDGSKSMTRLCIGAVVLFCLGIIAGLFFKLQAQISVGDFCNAVSAIAMFATGVCGSLYGINRGFEALENRAKGPEK